MTHQFPGFSLRVCSSSSQSQEMEKILVQWSDGRWKGTTSFVKKSAVKKGTIAVGEKVGVTWGKSKKTYNAQVLDICSGIRSPDIPRQDANDEVPFTFELASPAPERALDLPSPPQPTLQARLEDESLFSLMEKMDKLADAVSRVEARLLQRLDTLEEAVKKISESCVPHPQYLPMPSIPPAPLPMPPEISTPLPLSISYGQENFNSPTPVLQDASSRANIISPSVGEYTISSEELNLAMQGCRSRRNLAAQLAGRVFTMRERIGSNCRGKQGKTALEQGKLKAIFTCMHQFPLQRLETQQMADKEMRNAVDEICRKTKTPTDQENSVVI